MTRPFRIVPSLLAAFVLLMAGCALDRAELYEAGGVVPSDIDDLRVLTYRDDPATDDWTDLVVPDAAVLEEGDAFREDDSRTADEDEPADVRRLFTRIAGGRSVLVQLDRASGTLQVWEFVDRSDGGSDRGSDGALRTTGAADAEGINEVESGGNLTVVRGADAGEATVVVDGDDDVTVERIATHEPDDGVDLRIDVYAVDGAGRTTVTYEDDRGSTDYVVIAR